MTSIRSCELPSDALLGRYQHQGAYADCYVATLPRHVPHAAYVEAFYTTRLFKLERLLLAWFVARPSTDAQARQLASGSISSFAAWRVEARSPNQLLMCDMHGRTRSWLMVEPSSAEGQAATRLYFGSAVVPVTISSAGKPGMGRAFGLLLGFHKLYSRALLSAAASRLARQRPAEE
jgi:hypothetical protein